MADKRLPELPSITSVDDNDLVYVVDVSDTTDDPTGSSKQITKANFIAGAGTALDPFRENVAYTVDADGGTPGTYDFDNLDFAIAYVQSRNIASGQDDAPNSGIKTPSITLNLQDGNHTFQDVSNYMRIDNLILQLKIVGNGTGVCILDPLSVGTLKISQCNHIRFIGIKIGARFESTGSHVLFEGDVDISSQPGWVTYDSILRVEGTGCTIGALFVTASDVQINSAVVLEYAGATMMLSVDSVSTVTFNGDVTINASAYTVNRIFEIQRNSQIVALANVTVVSPNVAITYLAVVTTTSSLTINGTYTDGGIADVATFPVNQIQLDGSAVWLGSTPVTLAGDAYSGGGGGDSPFIEEDDTISSITYQIGWGTNDFATFADAIDFLNAHPLSKRGDLYVELQAPNIAGPQPFEFPATAHFRNLGYFVEIYGWGKDLISTGNSNVDIMVTNCAIGVDDIAVPDVNLTFFVGGIDSDISEAGGGGKLELAYVGTSYSYNTGSMNFYVHDGGIISVGGGLQGSVGTVDVGYGGLYVQENSELTSTSTYIYVDNGGKAIFTYGIGGINAYVDVWAGGEVVIGDWDNTGTGNIDVALASTVSIYSITSVAPTYSQTINTPNIAEAGSVIWVG